MGCSNTKTAESGTTNKPQENGGGQAETTTDPKPEENSGQQNTATEQQQSAD
ncbi:Hypothetical predicted protein [Mytilus galloprovincialis]|uniref:Uncharacterized protein n=1 Tax=Mytilus galloprovincialis TaxID=29158 RepID=A0A8B6FX46_MYTGA|nr:Hypothetical predicted protein [Mytilus galloprovincialis]